jgi:hypothetical protein
MNAQEARNGKVTRRFGASAVCSDRRAINRSTEDRLRSCGFPCLRFPTPRTSSIGLRDTHRRGFAAHHRRNVVAAARMVSVAATKSLVVALARSRRELLEHHVPIGEESSQSAYGVRHGHALVLLVRREVLLVCVERFLHGLPSLPREFLSHRPDDCLGFFLRRIEPTISLASRSNDDHTPLSSDGIGPGRPLPFSSSRHLRDRKVGGSNPLAPTALGPRDRFPAVPRRRRVPIFGVATGATKRSVALLSAGDGGSEALPDVGGRRRRR